MKKKLIQLMLPFALFAAGITVWTGCESSSSGDDALLEVTPASVGVAPGRTVTFTAALPEGLTNSAVYYPLRWQMQNPALGEFLTTEGDTAIYRARASGVNTITVRDQADRAGSAVITQ